MHQPTTATAAFDPLHRPTAITDLPSEILFEIFDHLHSATTLYGSYSYDPHSEHIEAIMNARLTCRTMCEVSSRHLLDFISVEPTEESLTRLEQVSQHPIISARIRGVHISFALYRPEMTVLSEFENSLAVRLFYEWKQANYADLKAPGVEGFEERRALIAQSRLIENFWTSGDLGSQPYFLKEVQKNTLVALKEYQRRYEEQERILNDTNYVRRIAQSLARMSRIKTVMVNDQATHHRCVSQRGQNVWQALGSGTSEIAQRFVIPEDWPGRSPDIPNQVALNLLAALSNVRFQDLRWDLRVKPLHAPQIYNYPILADLQKMSSQLTSVDLTWGNNCDTEKDRMDMKQWTSGLMLAMLGAAPLRSLLLRTSGHIYHREPTMDIAFTPSMLSSVLGCQQHGDFRSLILINAPIDRGVLDNISHLSCQATPDGSDIPKLHLELDHVYLSTSTSWAEALDVLQGHVDSTSIIRWPNGDMSGLDNVQKQEIFGNWYQQSSDHTTEADSYIRGDPRPNPINAKLLDLEE
ncbi:hypothetical protein F5Y16DRAFT_423471 [Xylariaceae sp. FL0255]|nr:hypothetical protein F5Y16DRAFT_423471 [Xylariaceae sp. FL0255]